MPESLRPLFRANQKDLYGIFMQACTDSILELARDPRYVGALVGILMVLHTWTQQLIYHPHLHCLVTGGGVTEEGVWQPTHHKFLFPLRALSKLIRGKVMSRIKKKRPDLVLPADAWKQQWVTHCTPWGQGVQAVLDYLARYVFRVAINNSRVVAMDEESVTFLYKDRKKNKRRICRLKGEDFMRRFLQHVLPQGFHKIRYGGLWHSSRRTLAQRIKRELEATQPAATTELIANNHKSPKVAPGAPCPCCETGRLVLIQRLPKPGFQPLARAP